MYDVLRLQIIANSTYSQPSFHPSGPLNSYKRVLFRLQLTFNCRPIIHFKFFNFIITRSTGLFHVFVTIKFSYLKKNLCLECPDSYYGQNCSSGCGHCVNSICNKTTGECACQPGWTPPLCQNCKTQRTFIVRTFLLLLCMLLLQMMFTVTNTITTSTTTTKKKSLISLLNDVLDTHLTKAILYYVLRIGNFFGKRNALANVWLISIPKHLFMNTFNIH